MNSDRVRLRDAVVADADLVDSWQSPAIRGEFNDFGIPPGLMPRDVLAAPRKARRRPKGLSRAYTPS